MSWTREETLAVVVVLCAALIGAAVMLRDVSITGLVVDEFGNTVNLPPAYAGPGSFSTPADTPLTIDLAPLFTDPENDALTFLVAEEDQVAVSVSDSLLKLIPAPGFAGERTLTIVASDGTNIVREYVKLVVEGTAVPPAEFSTPVEQPPAEETPQPVETPAEETPIPVEVPEFSIPTTPVIPAAKTFALNEQVRDDANTAVGRKVADEPGYETHFTSIGIESGQFVVRFYHDSPSALPVWIEGNVGAILTTNTPSQNEEVTLAVALDLGAIPQFRLHVGAESEIFDFGGFGSQEFTVSDVVSSCNGTGVVMNTSTSLAQNLISNQTCIVINASNIFLNCSGFTIAYDEYGQTQSYGILVLNQTNVTIRNCIIRDINATGTRGHAINLTKTNSSLIVNNTIEPNGTTANNGIRVQLDSYGNRIENNTIRTFGNGAGNTGIIVFTNSSNNVIKNNAITANGTSDNYGINTAFDVANTTIENNTVNTGGTLEANFGIWVTARSFNTSILSNTITTNGTTDNYGIRYTGVSADNLFANNTVTASGTGGGNYGIQLASGPLGNNTFLSNRITTTGNFSHGIQISGNAPNTTFTDTNITTLGNQSYGLRIVDANGTNFTRTILNSTEWINVTMNVFHNLTNTLFHAQSGSVRFLETISLNDSGPLDVTQQKFNITFNRAFLNSTNLSFMNRSAQITLFNLSLPNPIPFVDFEDDGTSVSCPGSICQRVSFAGGVIVFNVTRFTSYSGNQTGVPLSACAVINTSSFLTQNVTSEGTCMRFNNNSVQLDCSGFTITYDTNGSDDFLGINITNVANATVVNCIIRKTSATGNRTYAIGLFNATSARVENNTISTNGTGSNNGIHASTTNVQSVSLVTASSTFYPPYNCINTTGTPVNFCETCMQRGDVSCVQFGSRHCVGGSKYFRGEMMLSFNLTTVPLKGVISTIAGENFFCDLNTARIVPAGVRVQNRCGFPLTTTFTTGFVAGQNNLTCTVSGSGKHRDNGFRLAGFTYTIPAGRAPNLTIRWNNVTATGGNDTYGIYVDIANSTVSNNSVTTLPTSGGFFDHGIFLSEDASRNMVANNSVWVFAAESNGIHLDRSHNNTLINNSILNATRSSMHLERALNNTFNASTIALQNSLSSLFIAESDGNINYTSLLFIENQTQLLDIVTVSFNSTRVNSTRPGGQQFNRSARIDIFSLPFGDSLPAFDLQDTGVFTGCVAPRCTATQFNETTSILSFNVSSFTTYAAVSRSACGDLDSDDNVTGTIFSLINDVFANETCFNVMGDNLTLDCGGFSITYGLAGLANSLGINITSINDTNSTNSTFNITIRNCNIFQNSTTNTNGFGVFAENSSFLTLQSLNITTRSPGAHGIQLVGDANVTILNTAIFYGGVSATGSVGINISNLLNATLTNVTTFENLTNTGNGTAITFINATDLTVANSTLTTRGIDSTVIIGQHSGLVTLSGNRILANSTNALGVRLTNITSAGGSHNNITTGGTNASGFRAISSGNLTFTNTSVQTNGTFSTAIRLDNVTSATFTIATINTRNFSANGLLALHSTGVSALRFNVSTQDNESIGIVFTNTSHSIISYDNISTLAARAHGVFLSDCTNVTVNASMNGSTIVTRGLRAHGVLVDRCGNITIRNNYFVPEDDALRIEGNVIPHWSTHDIDTTNRGVGGGTIQYFGGAGSSPACPAGTTNAAGFYHITLVSCSGAFLNSFNSPEMVTFVDTNGSTLNSAQVRNNSRGMRVFFSRANVIANSTFTTIREDNNYGIHLLNSTRTNITADNVHTDGTFSNYGIFLQANSNSNNISFSNISTNGTEDNVGIFMNASAFNSIHNNTITTNGTRGSNTGIGINASSNNTIAANTITTGGTSRNIGIEIVGNNNQVHSNTITTRGTGRSNFGISVLIGPQLVTFHDGFEDQTLSPFLTGSTARRPDSNWSINNTVVNGGRFSAQSGRVGNQNATFQNETYLNLTRTITTENTISFSFNRTAAFNDVFNFQIDGTSRFRTASESNWAIYNFTVTPGTHTFLWNMSQQCAGGCGTSYAFVDDVRIYEEIRPESNNISNNAITTLGSSDNVGIVVTTNNSNAIAGNVIRVQGTGTLNRGIVVIDSNALSILNNRIYTFGTSHNYGVHFIRATNCTVRNNTIHTDGNESYNRGAYLFNSSYNLLENNNISTNGTQDNNGIDLEQRIDHFMNNTLLNNTINAKGRSDGNKGILFNLSSHNRAYLNNISTNGTLQNIGIMMIGEQIITFINNITADFNIIRTNGNESNNYGVHIAVGQGNNVSLNNITTNGTSANVGIRIDLGSDSNNASNNTIISSGTAGSNYGALIYTNSTDVEYNVIERSLINTTGTELNVGVLIQGVFNGNRARFNRVFANTIRTSGPSGSNYGVRLFMEAPSNVIQANAINTTGGGNSTGILVDTNACCEGPDSNDIFANTIQTGDSGGDNTGIQLLDIVGSSSVNNVNISNNTITTNGTVNNHGIVYVAEVLNTNATANRIITNGSARNHGIFLNSSSSSNTFAFTNITTNGTQSFGIFSSADLVTTDFRFIQLNNTVEWINTTATTTSTFENITFEERNGSIQIYPAFTLSGRQEVTKQRLNSTYLKAFLNSTNLTSMNLSSIVIFRGSTFFDPVPVVDREDDASFVYCAPPRCNELGYANNRFEENVSGWTTYSLVEGQLNISITKLDAPDPVNVSRQLNYTIQVNVTLGNASNITLVDLFPGLVIFLSGSPANFSGNNTFLIGNLSENQSFTVNITVLVQNDTNNVVLNNTANITFQNNTQQTRTAQVTESTTVVPGAEPPGPPPAAAGGGGGWTTPTVGGVDIEKPTQVPSQACSENWQCEAWSACAGGKQVRTCVDITGCNTTQFMPATEQTCVMPPEPVQEEPPLAMPELQPERFEPQPRRWTLCMILPVAIDGALIVLAALVLAYLILTAQKKDRRHWRAILDTPLVIILALFIWQYVACRQFLPLQYLVFVILLLSVVLVRLIEMLHGWQKGHVFEHEMDKAKHAAQDAGKFLGRTERRIAKVFTPSLPARAKASAGQSDSSLTLPKPKSLKQIPDAKPGFLARIFASSKQPTGITKPAVPKLPPAPAPVQMKVEASREGVFTKLFKPAQLQKPVVLPPLPRKPAVKAVPKQAAQVPAAPGVWSRLFGPRTPKDMKEIRSAMRHSRHTLEDMRHIKPVAALKPAPKPVQAKAAPAKLHVLKLPSWLKPAPRKDITIKPRADALTGDLKDVFATIDRSEKALERLDKTLRRMKKK